VPGSSSASVPDTRPRHAAVIGAGMLGLCTAWFLQEHDIRVTVLERTAVGAGASHGNAGWVTPALVAPLPDPAVLREGLRAIVARSPAVHLPAVPPPALQAFLWRFARNCTPARRDAALAVLAPLSSRALGAFDALAAGGVDAPVSVGRPVVAAYRDPAEREPLVAELEHVVQQGGPWVDYDLLDGDAVRQAEPVLGAGARAAVRIHGQRYLDPAGFVCALASSVRLRGGEIRTEAEVTGLRADADGVTVSTAGGGAAGGGAAGGGAGGADEEPDGGSSAVRGAARTDGRYDCAVVATGAWLGRLARPAGGRVRVQSGRGYSFSVPVRQLPAGPVYLPARRLACTPLPDGRLRVAGIMEFARPEAPLDRGRVARIAAGLDGLLAGADPGARADEWVGARPCTPDGLPVIGPARSPRVFLAGGHGMWGITLGPATGLLLARAIATGRPPAELAPFSPLR
jgi:D-amino-acid dehydrogenase